MRILLTVCGSISAYKSYDIARGLINEGHQVKVILTKGALEFIKAQTFRYLGVEAVYTYEDDFNFPKLPSDSNVLHIELARWCEKLVIAPASANTIANLSMGRANDLLSSIFLALEKEKPVIIFPAMNTQMLNHTLVQENMSVLTRLKKVEQVQIMPTKDGNLACGETGEGKLEDVNKIIDLVTTITTGPTKKHFLVTTGATISPLDSVRFLTNPSSGKTGYVLAKEALKRGHKVTMLAGKYSCQELNNFENNKNYSYINFTSTRHLHQLVNQYIDECDAYLSPAAIGDIEFNISEEKIKKSNINNSLEVIPATDILKEVVTNHKSKFIVGFAAETDLSFEVLNKKWNSKPVNLLIGTKVSNGLESNDNIGFQTDEAQYAIFKDGQITDTPVWSKKNLAHFLVNQVEGNYAY